MKTLVVNFSGGRSSGNMVSEIEANPKFSEYQKLYIFCNTGCEHEKTLEFVDNVDKHFGLNLVWLEGVTNPIKGKGISAKTVCFDTASRNGEPFEAMIKKHGIPNISTPHCTRELKTRTTCC